MKLFMKKISQEETDRINLLDDIEKTKEALRLAYNGLDNAVDPDLIDCYIYQVNSVLMRYKFLLNQATILYSLPDHASNEAVREALLHADTAGPALSLETLV